MTERCPWCGQDPLYVAYHDHEWGVPEWDSRALWEKLVLDGFQAGLSWITILKKRDSFRAAFDGFDPTLVASWGEAQVAAALANPGIIRHRGKIEATVKNARAYLALQEKGDFAALLWNFVGGTPLQNTLAAQSRARSQSPAPTGRLSPKTAARASSYTTRQIRWPESGRPEIPPPPAMY